MKFKTDERLLRKIYVAIAIFFFPLSVFATSQVGDILIWKGDTLTLFSNPLELIADYDSLRMKIHDEIERLTYPNLKDDEPREAIFSTACWRGYRAEWIVVNDSIFLNNIYHCHNDGVKINLYDIFQNNIKNEKIFAFWINGELFLPQGECIQYVHLGYHSIYELETVLNVENGLIKNIEVFNNRIAKVSDFLKNAEYGGVNEFTSKNINWNILPDLTDKLYRVNISVELNENGQIERINEEYTHMLESWLIKKTQRADSSVFVTDINNAFIQESIRIAKLIPEWNVIYQRGKVVGSGLYIEFSERIRKKYEKK
jgi:hypothetical protein